MAILLEIGTEGIPALLEGSSGRPMEDRPGAEYNSVVLEAEKPVLERPDAKTYFMANANSSWITSSRIRLLS